ncbi:MAG: Ldh family oxidoreductase [Alphaproteobacteria bacterium]
MEIEISVADAHALATDVLKAKGQSAEYATLIADHLIDCELRDLAYGGLARLVSIVERLDRTGPPARPVEVAHETPVSAKVLGNDNLGYVVAYKAAEIAIAKAKETGIGFVGADGTWYTGMLSYFAEMMAAEGMVSMIASNASPWVAPAGAVDGRFGTNPICFGFPSETDPIIWDIGTSTIMHAEVVLAKRLGAKLPEGVAFDAAGAPTTDPEAALGGAFAAWGGHKGSGLAHVVQLLGVLAGSPIQPPELAEFGCVILAVRTDLLMPEAEYRKRVSEYADLVRAARPVPGGPPPRMPFDRSAQLRRDRRAAGVFSVPNAVLARLRAISAA